MGRLKLTDRQRVITESITQEFNNLTVLSFLGFRLTPSKRRVPMVHVKCRWGNTKNVSLWDVRSGRTKTCGVSHVHYEDRSIPAFNNIYNNSYKRRAIKAGLKFTITKEQFRHLSQQACHYCGTFPNAISYRGKRKERGIVKSGQYLSQFIYNGLDRIDSSGGYVPDNVVTCCSICNHAKHTMSYTDFVGWLN